MTDELVSLALPDEIESPPTEQLNTKTESDHESKNPEDIQLMVEGIRLGEVDAQVEVDSYLRKRFFSYFKKFSRELADRAEDLTQEALLRVFMRIGQFNESQGSFLKWAFAIAHNLAIDEIRKLKTRPQLTGKGIQDYEFVLPAQEDVENNAIAHMTGIEVMDAIAQLPPDQGAVIRLVYFGQMSESEAAERLEIALGTVKTRKRLGLQKLRDLLAKVAT